MSIAAAAGGGELKIPSVSVLPEDGMVADGPPTAVKRRPRPGRKLNGVVRGDTKSLYISPAIEKELVVSDVCILDGGAPTCEQFSLRVVYVSS
ncbi:hypothetical protein GBAR_LOCUS25806 [Geodia barretti]|uniref:Uncharacterized protein n=1 Tax=Geodia barretti TaxID=519541 RepID=A0AA35TFB1_GEOBA|nr:hypothetical protein GBAR_LOCUS25806 [Geodia barretti]